MPPTRRSTRRIAWLLWPVVALISLVVVAQASFAAFSARTSNSGNSFAVGTVELTDDDAGSALFALTNLKPGSTGSRCIVVTSSGSLPSTIKLYATDPSTSNSLASYVTLAIAQGSGGSFGSCTGFTASGSALFSGTLAAFTSASTAYSNGVGSWAPSGGSTESRSFRFTYTVSDATPDSVQRGTASFGLTWEAQST